MNKKAEQINIFVCDTVCVYKKEKNIIQNIIKEIKPSFVNFISKITEMLFESAKSYSNPPTLNNSRSFTRTLNCVSF